MSFSAEIDDRNIIQRVRLTAPANNAHKYDRGSAFVFSGPALKTGASRLTAQAALGIGTGLVTIIGEEEALKEHAAHVSAVMLAQRENNLQSIDGRVTAMAVGPAYGANAACRQDVVALIRHGRPMVIDADGLTAFEGHGGELFPALHDQIILTPHEGEFARLFPYISLKSRVDAAKEAASKSGAIILLKGGETVIAKPDGGFAINIHAAPWLATAGSGDVLTGLICGILAQGIDAFEATCCACWIHGDIGRRHGAGLTAERMIDQIPLVLTDCMLE